MNIEPELKKTIATGRFALGATAAKKAMKTGGVKLFIVAKDCPFKKELLERADAVPFHMFPGNSLELGRMCDKPFAVSVISIFDEGKSGILKMATG